MRSGLYNRKLINDAVIARVKQLIEEGHSLTRVAHIVGFSRSGIHRALRNTGITESAVKRGSRDSISFTTKLKLKSILDEALHTQEGEH